MIHIFLLFSLLFNGCSTKKLSRTELVNLSISHKEIPTQNKETAKNFMDQQRKYLTLLYENFPDSPMPDTCRHNKIIGEVIETDGELRLVSLVRVDRFAKPNRCETGVHSAWVWDVYFYCAGDSQLMNMKIKRGHLPEFKDVSLCE
jgi:hypothetical protein